MQKKKKINRNTNYNIVYISFKYFVKKKILLVQIINPYSQPLLKAECIIFHLGYYVTI